MEMKIMTWKGFITKNLIVAGVACLMQLGLVGCDGTTSNPTGPSNIVPTPTATGTPDPNQTPLPTPTSSPAPTPLATGTPDPNQTPLPTPTATPTVTSSYNYGANTPYDPNIRTLQVDGTAYPIMMDYTGEIHWYKVRIPDNAETISVSLTAIPEKCDFDLAAFDSKIKEIGRSSHTGNTIERLVVSPVESLLYVQIYSYNGRGEALLTLKIEKTKDVSPGNTPSQLTYEQVLTTYYPRYPRGTASKFLERSVESLATEEITCRASDTLLSGKLIIGNYAHVGRELLESVDYVDGWAVAVFNGPVSLLDKLKVIIRVTIFAPELGLQVQAPPEMQIEGHDYLLSDTGGNVYYLAQAYGDLWRNSSGDIRISSGVVGDAGVLFSNRIFTQQVDVQWSWTTSNGTTCSGKATGKQIIDFEMNRLLFFR